MVPGLGRSVAMVSTSFRLSGRATNSCRSGPDRVLRMAAINVVGGGLDARLCRLRCWQSAGFARFRRFQKRNLLSVAQLRIRLILHHAALAVNLRVIHSIERIGLNTGLGLTRLVDFGHDWWRSLHSPAYGLQDKF